MNASTSSLSRSVALSSPGIGRLPFGGGAGAAQHLRKAAAGTAAAAGVERRAGGAGGTIYAHTGKAQFRLFTGWGGREEALAAARAPGVACASRLHRYRPPISPHRPIVRSTDPAAGGWQTLRALAHLPHATSNTSRIAGVMFV